MGRHGGDAAAGRPGLAPWAAGTAGRRARVAMLAEGTYPYVTGGVSTWCDQIIRGMPEYDFEIVAVVASAGRPLAWTLPDNVVGVSSAALWGFVPEDKPPRGDDRSAFLDALRPFVQSILEPHLDDATFALGLMGLFEFAQRHSLTSALMSDDAAELLGQEWELSRADKVSVLEVMKALELLEHSLRPLAAPVVRADLCHATSNGLPSLLALMAKWRYGTPFIMSEHGVYLRERYLAFQTFDTPWSVKYLVLSFYRRLTRLAYGEASVIAPVNVYNQRWEIEHGADPDIIVTALNGVDVEKYPVADDEPDDQIIAWVGRIDPLKDLETLIDAFGRLQRRMPRVWLDLYGPVPAGNEKYYKKLRELVGRRQLGTRGQFRCSVSPVSKAYHGARVIALSSISEGLPYTVIEAMMSGRATVSTDVGGVREVVGDTGLLVPPRDPKALADALERVLSDDELRHDLARRAAVRGRSYFPLEQMLGTFRSEYAMLIEPQAPEFTEWPDVSDDDDDGPSDLDATLDPNETEPEPLLRMVPIQQQGAASEYASRTTGGEGG